MSKKSDGSIYSALINIFATEPMMVESGWMEATLNLFKDFTAQDLLALETKRSSPLENTCTATYRENVAIVPVSGPIMAQAGFLYYMLGIGTLVQDFTRDLQAAIDNPRITDILIPFDTPGGSISGINEAGNLIKTLGAIKPITGYVTGSCCSAGYWWGTSCNELVGDATCRVGSIGVMATVPNTKEDSKYEITIVNTSSPNKRPDVSTSKGKSELLRQVNDLADVFIGVVAENIGVSRSKVEKDFGAGGVLVGQKAVDIGMIHRLGSFEGLILEKINSPATSATSGGTKAQGESIMKLSDLKKTDPEAYDKLMADAKAEAEAEVLAADKKKKEDDKKAADKKKKDDEEKEDDLKKKKASDDEKAAMTAKDREITELKEVNAENAARLQALEKKDMINEAKNLATSAASIIDKKLVASAVPERFHAKVQSQIDHNKFVGSDGVFDTVAFNSAIDTEVKDWETSLSGMTSPLQGLSTAVGVESDSKEAEAEALANDLFKYVDTGDTK